jgi:hypothetical protein
MLQCSALHCIALQDGGGPGCQEGRPHQQLLEFSGERLSSSLICPLSILFLTFPSPHLSLLSTLLSYPPNTQTAGPSKPKPCQLPHCWWTRGTPVLEAAVPALSNLSPAGVEPVASAGPKCCCCPGPRTLPRSVGPFHVGQQDSMQDLAFIATSSPYPVRLALYLFLNKSMWIPRTSR